MIELVQRYGNAASHHRLLQAPVLFAMSGDVDALRQLLPDGIHLIGVLNIDETGILCVMPDQSVYELKGFPAGYLGAAGLHDRHRTDLQNLVRLLSKWSGRSLAGPETLHGPNAVEALLGWVCRLCLADRSRLLASSLTSQLELAELRGVHETLQSDFQAVEGFIASRNIQPVDMIFANPVSPDLGETDRRATRITQVLPVANYGLSSVDIAIGDTAGGHDLGFGLDCSLVSIESGDLLARWALPVDEISVGWINLQLPKGLSGATHTLQLIIRPLNGIGQVLPLKLGPAQPLGAFRAVMTSGATRPLAASLAFRCWSGLPGMSPPAARTIVTPMGGGDRVAVRAVPLSSGYLAQIEQCLQTWYPGRESVSFSADLGVVECHPPPLGITLARLPSLLLPDPCRIEGQGFVRGGSASPHVEFGILFADDAEEDVISALSPDGDAARLRSFSGWMSVGAASASLISCTIAEPGVRGCPYLVTRMKDEADGFAQACFRNLKITSLSDGAPSRAPDLQDPKGARHISLAELDRIGVDQGATASASVRRSSQGPLLDLRGSAEGAAVFSVRGLSARSAGKVALRAVLADGQRAVDFGVAVMAGESARRMTAADIAAVDDDDPSLIFSGFARLGPSESAGFEIDISGAFGHEISLLFVIDTKSPASCVSVSDLWLIDG